MSNFADVSTDVKTIVGEPLEYPSSPNPVISSNIITIVGIPVKVNIDSGGKPNGIPERR
ncbi:MAG: hypothetical protein WB762_21120 [Candidatus Sulfotelmatobacter sp.]